MLGAKHQGSALAAGAFDSWTAPPQAPAKRGRARMVLKLIGACVGFVAGFTLYRGLAAPHIDLDGYAAGTTVVSHVSEHGQYRALFPSEPKIELNSVEAAGLTLNFTMATSEGREGGVEVAYIDYPPEAARLRGAQLDRALRGGADGAAANAPNGRLISARYTTFSGRRAMRFRMTSDDGVLDGEFFLVGRRAYLLMVGSEHGSPRALARLLGSFKLI